MKSRQDLKKNNGKITCKKQMKNEKKTRKKNEESKKNSKFAKDRYNRVQQNSSNQEFQSKQSLVKSSSQSQKSKSDSGSENDSQKSSSKQQSEISSSSRSDEQKQISQPEKYRISSSESGIQDNLISNNTKNSDYVDLSKPYRVRLFYKVDEKDPSKVLNFKVFEQIEQEPSSASQKQSIRNYNKKNCFNSPHSKVYIPHKINRKSSDQSEYESKPSSKQKSGRTVNKISIKSKTLGGNKNSNMIQQKQKSPRVLRKNSNSSSFVKDLYQNFEYDTPSEQKIIQISSSPSQSCKLLSNQSQIKQVKKKFQSNKIKKAIKPVEEKKPGKKNTRNNSKNKKNIFSDSSQDENYQPFEEKQKKNSKTSYNMPPKIQKPKKITVKNQKAKPITSKQKNNKNKQKKQDFFTAVKTVKPKQQKVFKNKKVQKQVSQQLPKISNRKKQQSNENISMNQKQFRSERIQEEQKINEKLKNDIESLKTTIKNRIPSTLEQMIKMIDENKQHVKEKQSKLLDQNFEILNNPHSELNYNQKNTASLPKFGFHHWHLTLPSQNKDYEIMSFQGERICQQKDETKEKQINQQIIQKNIQNYDFSFEKVQQTTQDVKDKIIQETRQSNSKQSPEKVSQHFLNTQKQFYSFQNNSHLNSPPSQKYENRRGTIQPQNEKIDQNQIQVNNQEVDWFEDIFNEFPRRQYHPSQEIDKLSPQKQIFYGQIDRNKSKENNIQFSFDPIFSDDSFVDLAEQKGLQQKKNHENYQGKNQEKMRFENQSNRILQNVKEIQKYSQIQNLTIQNNKHVQNQQWANLDQIKPIPYEKEECQQKDSGQWVNILNQNKINQNNPEKQPYHQFKNENESSSQQEQCVVNYCISDDEGSEQGEIMIIQRLCTKKKGHPIFFHPLSQAVKKQQAKIKWENCTYNYGNQSEDEFENNEVLRQLKNQFLLNQNLFNIVKKDNESDRCSLSQGQQRLPFNRNLQNEQQIQIDSQQSSLQFLSQRLKKQCKLKRQQDSKRQHQIKNEYVANMYEKQSGELEFSQNNSEISESQGEMKLNTQGYSNLQNANAYSRSQNMLEKQSKLNNFNDRFNQYKKRSKKPKNIIEIQPEQSQSGQMTPPERYQLPSYLIPNNRMHAKKNSLKSSQDIQKYHVNPINKSSLINNTKNYQYPQINSINSERFRKLQKFPYRTIQNQTNSQQKQKISQKTQQSTNLPPNKMNSPQISEPNQSHQQKIQKLPPINEPIKSINKLQQQKILKIMQQFQSKIQQINQVKKSKIITLDIVDDDEEAAKKMLSPQINNQPPEPSQASQNSFDEVFQQMQREIFNYKIYIKTDEMKNLKNNKS